MIVTDCLSVLSKHESGQKMYGLSRVGIVLGGLCVVLKLEWNPLHPRTPPIQISGAFTLLEPHFHFFLFFFVAILLLLLVLVILRILLLLLPWPLLCILFGRTT